MSIWLTHSFLPSGPLWMILANLPTCQQQTLGGSSMTSVSRALFAAVMGKQAGLLEDLNMLAG
jgi:hypothetical protein